MLFGSFWVRIDRGRLGKLEFGGFEGLLAVGFGAWREGGRGGR